MTPGAYRDVTGARRGVLSKLGGGLQPDESDGALSLGTAVEQAVDALRQVQVPRLLGGTA
jgi:hypothetical protein